MPCQRPLHCRSHSSRVAKAIRGRDGKPEAAVRHPVAGRDWSEGGTLAVMNLVEGAMPGPPQSQQEA